MAKLYVFGIGGTGSRVLKSLVMLLASGLKLNDFDLVPVIIDPHKDLPELNDCKSLLKLYAGLHDRIYDKTTGIVEGFFKTKLSTLKAMATDSGLKDDFEFDEKYDMPFGEFLDMAAMLKEEPVTKDLLSLLYAKQTFLKPLSVGFKGNPHVGTVVLNALKDGPGFKALNSFAPGDKIFIISSIFGGTGAAGFPLLLKNFRAHSKTAIQECQIGALTVMPYFKLTDPEKLKDEKNKEYMSSDIDSNNFMTKTKAALSYYIKPDFAKLYNALFYIADPDKQNKPYENNEKTQPNKAHLVELIGALSIFKFAETDFTTRGEVYEYCVKTQNAAEIDFKNIADETRKILGRDLASFYMFTKLHSSNKNTPGLPFNKKYKYNSLFEKDTSFFQDFDTFVNDHFLKWLQELQDNERSFNAINVSDKTRFHGLIKGYEIQKRFGEGLLFPSFDLSQAQLELSKSLMRKEFTVMGEANKIAQYFSACRDGILRLLDSKINLN